MHAQSVDMYRNPIVSRITLFCAESQALLWPFINGAGSREADFYDLTTSQGTYRQRYV